MSRWIPAAWVVGIAACAAPQSHPVDRPIRYQAGLLAPALLRLLLGELQHRVPHGC